ncbi:MAG: protein-S-isoprenylcysteine O-methyltransferase [Pseudomonadota bacterium]
MNLQVIFRAIMMVIMVSLLGLILWRWRENGWGSIVWLASVVLMMVIRTPHERRNKENEISEQFAVSTERALLLLVGIGGTGLPILYLVTGWPGYADVQAPLWLPVIGLLLLIPGLWLFWRSHADLGRNWSVTTELREEHTLISNGVYKRIRHPMYSAIWLIFLAYPFLIHNWIAGPAAIVAYGILYVVRVPIEEAMMRQQFGQAYIDYMSKTGRLWPRFKK